MRTEVSVGYKKRAALSWSSILALSFVTNQRLRTLDARYLKFNL